MPDLANPTNMRLRFFTLASSVILSVTGVGAKGQPIPTPTPKVGCVRFWDMLPAASGKFEVRKVGAAASEGNMLSGSAYDYSSYVQFPVGKYQLGVFKKGQETTLKLFNVDLKPDSFFTILISPQSIDMFDDTVDPKETSGTLTVRNFFPGIVVSAAAASRAIVNSLAYGQSKQAIGFPLQRTEITLHTTLPNGTPSESTAEADFHASKHATLLIIPDSYGRFRPRVTIDGSNR
jgi:hypothetical protein